jgi:hypothetical protein
MSGSEQRQTILPGSFGRLENVSATLRIAYRSKKDSLTNFISLVANHPVKAQMVVMLIDGVVLRLLVIGFTHSIEVKLHLSKYFYCLSWHCMANSYNHLQLYISFKSLRQGL